MVLKIQGRGGGQAVPDGSQLLWQVWASACTWLPTSRAEICRLSQLRVRLGLAGAQGRRRLGVGTGSLGRLVEEAAGAEPPLELLPQQLPLPLSPLHDPAVL